ncbi:MAG: hypothetical protein HFK03_02145 [Clostridia bacterium]|jgi:hypothetical protein|nr:hypothetical protein [Clostridia bacterium]
MEKNETKGYLLTREQIDEEARRILASIKANEFPQMRLKNNGVHRDISEEEFEISSQLIYNR